MTALKLCVLESSPRNNLAMSLMLLANLVSANGEQANENHVTSLFHGYVQASGIPRQKELPIAAVGIPISA